MGKPNKYKVETNRSKRRNLERKIENGQFEEPLSAKKLLFSLKYDLISGQTSQLLSAFTEEQFINIVGDLLPKTYKEIRAKSQLYPKNEFAKELIWYNHILLRFPEEVNLYLKYENQFDNYFLKGEYNRAETILKKIESEICVSQTSIEKNLLLAEYYSGFKKNKEVLAQIIEEKPHPITSLLSKYTSIKVEKNQSFVKYEEVLEKFVKKINDPLILEYVSFKLNFFSCYHYKFKGFILGAESSTNIVDMYNSFIGILMMTAAETEIPVETKEVMVEVLRSLSKEIEDLRIKLLLLSLGDYVEIKPNIEDKQFNELLNLYTIGEYAQALKKSVQYLQSNALCFEAYIIYVKATLNIKQSFENIFSAKSMAGQTLEDVYNIFSKNEQTQLSIQSLHKNFNSIGFTSWGCKGYQFYNTQYSITDPELNVSILANLNSLLANPSFSISLPDLRTSVAYLKDISIPNINESVIEFWTYVNTKLYKQVYIEKATQIEPFRKSIYEAQALEKTGIFEESLDLYKTLLTRKDFDNQRNLVHNREEIAHGMLLCYLKTLDFKNALELATDTNLQNPNISTRLRYNFLINKIRDSQEEELVSNISTPIFLHQYQRYINPKDLWIAYDNFLSFHDLNFPKEIGSIAEKFDQNKLIYFLKHICKPEVYDSSYLFENQEELENERIEICLLLCNLDEQNLDEYIYEISEISRNQLIRKGIKQIDESKIYVDVAGIKKAMDKDLIESFNRFLNLQSLPIAQIKKLDTSNDDFLISYYDKSGDKSIVDKSAIRITTYSTFEHFRDMVHKIRNMFIASNEYGIDTYLSMRIRHGTLLGELRSVFETFNLITKKEDSSDTYQDNMFWLEKELFATNQTRGEFNKIMADFSTQIDKLSNELKNQKLQISTESKITEGLFDYSLSEKDIMRQFKLQVDTVIDHDVFFDNIISFLWERTEHILTHIREEISGPIKTKVLLLLTELGRKLEALINKADFPELNEIIQDITLCQTEISNKLDKISEWFNRSNNKVINEFYLDLPMDAALVTLKRLNKDYHSFNPSIDNHCDIKFEGDTFQHFTYIMQNLMHNILKHSRLNVNELDVNVLLEEENGELTISISNNIAKTIDLSIINGKIETTRNLLKGTHTDERTRKEDGTGYLKIKKTIITDLLRTKFTIELPDVDEERTFSTIIKFDITDLEKTYNESITN